MVEPRNRSRFSSLVVMAVIAFGGSFSLRANGVSSPGEAGTTGAALSAAERTMARSFVPKFARPTAIPHPDDNAYTPARETLGRTLFFDPRLSGSGWISCASCHNPGFSWGDGLPRAIGDGMKTLGRRTPTILNLAWAEAMFWDGRADTLEAQALGPITAPGEMNLPLDKMIGRVDDIAGYRELFAQAYPGEPIAPATIARAIATFERRVVSADAPFDRWLKGDDEAISVDAQRGFVLFNSKARCEKCHSGWRFTDDSFHDIGVPGDDVGRGALLREIDVMQHAFKTPTLRNVDQRAPYLHNGSVATLDALVDFYDRGGLAARPSLSPELKPLGLTTEEKRQVVAFLRTLTSVDQPLAVPTLPR
jgi:cytochrome c peroxidase